MVPSGYLTLLRSRNSTRALGGPHSLGDVFPTRQSFRPFEFGFLDFGSFKKKFLSELPRTNTFHLKFFEDSVLWNTVASPSRDTHFSITGRGRLNFNVFQ
jgi:hypothetical protein